MWDHIYSVKEFITFLFRKGWEFFIIEFQQHLKLWCLLRSRRNWGKQKWNDSHRTIPGTQNRGSQGPDTFYSHSSSHPKAYPSKSSTRGSFFIPTFLLKCICGYVISLCIPYHNWQHLRLYSIFQSFPCVFSYFVSCSFPVLWENRFRQVVWLAQCDTV